MPVEICSITIDENTKQKLDTYAKEHAISRSAVIRLAVNEYFLKLGG